MRMKSDQDERIEVKAEMRKMNGMYVMRFRWYEPENAARKEKCISTRLRATKGNQTKANQIMWDRRKIIENEVNLDYVQRQKEKTDFTLFIQSWIRELKKTNQLEKNTIQGYESKIRTYIVPYFSNKDFSVQNIKVADIEEFYIYLQNEKGLSPSTIDKTHYCINNAFKEACRKEIINRNPAEYARRPRKTRYIAKTLSLEEWNKLRDVFRGDVIEVPVMLSAFLGLRRSETLGLRWSQVNLETQIVTINNKIISIKGNTTLEKESVKRQASYRKICIPDELNEFLKDWKQKQEEYKFICADRYIYTIGGKENDFVCTWPLGQLIKPDYLTKHFREVIQKSNIKTVRFHDLRHTIATLLNENGASLQDIKELLGHSTISTTSNIYIGFTEEIARKNAQLTQNLVCDS